MTNLSNDIIVKTRTHFEVRLHSYGKTHTPHKLSLLLLLLTAQLAGRDCTVTDQCSYSVLLPSISTSKSFYLEKLKFGHENGVQSGYTGLCVTVHLYTQVLALLAAHVGLGVK